MISRSHTTSFVAQATDYGVWGDVIREQKADPKAFYRYGYQGQFAERDTLTGWNHFELREYDPVIGRWTAMDPMRQYWSPYVGMGNNPVTGVDPDGGEESPYYDEFGNFLGVDENGFAGEVRIMDQFTWDNLNIGNDKGYISSEVGYANSVGMANAGLSLGSISSILTDITSRLPDINSSLVYSEFSNLLYGNKISVYNDLTGEGFNNPTRSWFNNTVVKDGRIKVTAVTSQLETTVEQIQLTYGIHEFQGHGYMQGILRLSNFKHSDVYDLEKNGPWLVFSNRLKVEIF